MFRRLQAVSPSNYVHTKMIYQLITH
jgi:hypothetical protein